MTHDKPRSAEELAAQLWCRPAHEHKIMDPELCRDIAELIKAERDLLTAHTKEGELT